MKTTTLLHITPNDFLQRTDGGIYRWSEKLTPKQQRRVSVKGQWIRYTGTEPAYVFQSKGTETLKLTI